MANLTVSTDVDNFMQAANNAAARTSLGVPAATTTISAGTGLTGGGDLSANRTLTVAYGTTSGTAAEGNDARLSNARTPTAHASTHAAAGSDPITITAAQISGSLTQNTSGTAAGLSATLAITSGGTGQTTASAALAALGGIVTANVQVFTSSGTWTKPANAKQVCVECLSGGGGGGAGGKAASGTAVYGGGGGGGGGYSRVAILASDLTDATYAVTVGSGGTGAIYGGNATAGSASSFAPSSSPTSFLARAQSGSAPGGSGGVTAPTAGSGGAPNSNAGGGSSITGNASAGSASTHTATGGGGGGGISAVPTGYAGGQGGTNAICNLASLGGATSGSGNGVSATASTARTGSSLIINGSGGGGGGASTFATGSGGNGADGSGYGSGGGGGGATIGSGTGGNGGNGASGVVVVTTYF